MPSGRLAYRVPRTARLPLGGGTASGFRASGTVLSSTRQVRTSGSRTPRSARTSRTFPSPWQAVREALLTSKALAGSVSPWSLPRCACPYFGSTRKRPRTLRQRGRMRAPRAPGVPLRLTLFAPNATLRWADANRAQRDASRASGERSRASTKAPQRLLTSASHHSRDDPYTCDRSFRARCRLRGGRCAQRRAAA